VVLFVLALVAIMTFAQLAPGIPHNETFIANQLAGRVGTLGKFNLWAGWRSQDRGFQNLHLTCQKAHPVQEMVMNNHNLK